MSTSTAQLKLLTIEKGLRFEVATGKVTFTLESGPDATLPNPVQAVLGAAGGCSMDVISILRKQRQQVTGYEIEITAERREASTRLHGSTSSTASAGTT
jgi:putative redox protein